MQVRKYQYWGREALWTYRLGCETLAQLPASLSSPKSNSSPGKEDVVDLVDWDITSKSSSPIALRNSASDAVLLLGVWLAAEKKSAGSTSDTVRLVLRAYAGAVGMARLSMRGDAKSNEPVVEPRDDTDNEEKGVSGLEEDAGRSSSPKP